MHQRRRQTFKIVQVPNLNAPRGLTGLLGPNVPPLVVEDNKPEAELVHQAELDVLVLLQNRKLVIQINAPNGLHGQIGHNAVIPAVVAGRFVLATAAFQTPVLEILKKNSYVMFKLVLIGVNGKNGVLVIKTVAAVLKLEIGHALMMKIFALVKMPPIQFASAKELVRFATKIVHATMIHVHPGLTGALGPLVVIHVEVGGKLEREIVLKKTCALAMQKRNNYVMFKLVHIGALGKNGKLATKSAVKVIKHVPELV